MRYFCVMNFARQYLPAPVKDSLFAVYSALRDSKEALPYKITSVKARLASRQRTKTVLFYPERPKPQHVIYKMLHLLGCRMTTNPCARADVAFNFETTTFATADLTLVSLSKQYRMINYRCRDISKRNVEGIFREVFGYASFIDPRTYQGKYVRKSDDNALHDGVILEGQREPDDEHIYQVLVDTIQDGESALDLRVPVIGGVIPFVYLKYKPIDIQFLWINTKSEIAETQMVFSAEEQAKILEFCEKLGLDCGELDVARDVNTNMVYILDANTTPQGPPNHLTETDTNQALRRMAACFQVRFL